MLSPRHWRIAPRCYRLLLLAICCWTWLLTAPAAYAQVADSSASALEPITETRLDSSEQQDADPLSHRQRNWLIYTALGLGLLNLVLMYMLYRSPGHASPEAASSFDPLASSRTQKRLDKRKREVEELREQMDKIGHELRGTAGQQMTPGQIQDLVRALVRDELSRQATASRPS